MAAIRRTYEIEKQKFKRNWQWYLFSFILFGVIPWMNYHYVDGIYYNQVLSWGEGVNPSALQTVERSYCPGDTVQIYTAFCKTRHTLDIERSMYMSNGQLVRIELPENVSELPVGCYPQTGQAVVSLHEIPENTLPGFHITLGNSQYVIEGDRKRQQDWQTAPYMVLPEEECKLE